MMNFMAYRASLFVWFGITALEVLSAVFLWYFVYKSNGNQPINGYTFEQMIVYFVFTNIFTFVTFSTETLWQINKDIKDGTIAISLTKPVSYRLRMLFTTFGSAIMPILVLGVPAYTIAIVVFYLIGYLKITNVWLFILSIVLFLILQFLAIVINDGIEYLCGIMCFYTTGAWGLNQFKEAVVKFFSGAVIPIAFFPAGFANVVNYLPFIGLSQNPILVLMMETKGVPITMAIHFIGLSLTWVVIIEAIDYLLFRNAVKKVMVQGG